MRYALYFTPSKTHPLSQDAANWLGYDPSSPAKPFEPHAYNDVVLAPRRYGFHATLKAPFRLANGKTEEQLVQALDAFCAQCQPFHIPALRLDRIGKFFALVPDGACHPLNRLSRDLVQDFDPFRAPLTHADIERRNPEKLTDNQRKHLMDWGYPYVLDEFRFHMTLTGQVADEDAHAIGAELTARFGSHLGRPIAVNAVSLFRQAAQDENFTILSRAPIGAAHHMKVANQ